MKNLSTSLVKKALSAFAFVIVALSLNLQAKTEEGTPTQVYTPSETAEFKTLATATLDALNAGKKEEMVTKLTDLETAWDAKESDLKPKDEATWTIIDKTLDKGISSLRSSKYKPEKGKAALESLISELTAATKH